MQIDYFTRDANGNDFVKKVSIKEFPVEAADYICPVCHRSMQEGCQVKKIVSSKFTDWAFLGAYVCKECSKLFSIYPYSYIADSDGIRLLNVRQLKNELCKPQKPPFRFCITTTQKKHLFYRSTLNDSSDYFAVNLETETIFTTPDRMRYLFNLIELLQTLGASKKAMQEGEISFVVLQKTGFSVLDVLQNELKTSREIQIPLFCGQKRDITEEEALCYLNSQLTMS